VIFLLYSTGFVWEVAEGYSGSISLSPYGDSKCYNEKEAFGAKWLSDHSDPASIVYGDPYSQLLLADWFHLENINRKVYGFPLGISQMQKDAHIYLRSWNIEKQEVLLIHGWGKREYVNFDDAPELFSLISAKNKVYDNGGAQTFVP